MYLVANLLVALVALLHVYFLVLEMFLWTKPLGLQHLRPVARRRRRTPPCSRPIRDSITASSPRA